jgi:hypothetical protein
MRTLASRGKPILSSLLITLTLPAGITAGTVTAHASESPPSEARVLEGVPAPGQTPVPMPAARPSKPATYSLRERIRKEGRGKSCELLVRYPEFQGSGHRAIDVLVRREVNRIANGVKKEYENEIMAFGESACRDDSGPVNYSLDYTVPYQGPRYWAVEFTESMFTGGAHPNRLVFGLNLDLKTGRALRLANIVKPDGLGDINRLVKKGIADQLGAEESFFEGYPTLDQPQFTITAEGLRFVFSPYEVAAYANTPHPVTIPWESLRARLKPGFSPKEF